MNITLEKTMPSNLEAERLILGSMLMENQIPDNVKGEDFYLDSHRKIFDAAQDIAERGDAIDLFSIKTELHTKNKLEACGGAAYLASLTDGMPRMELAPQYVRAVKNMAALRRLIGIGNSAMSDAFVAEDDPREIVSRVLDGCDGINSSLEESEGLKPIANLLSLTFDSIEARASRQDSGAYPTGFKDLDRMLAGGVRPQNQVIVAGRPGSGKTAFAVNMMVNMAKSGYRCGYFSLEMGAHELIERMLASEARVDLSRMAMGFMNREEWDRIRRAADLISNLPIWIDDSTGITVADTRSRIRRVREGLHACWVDYLQLLSPPARLSRSANEFEQVAAISKGMKFMAKSLNMPLISLSQLSRASEKRKDRTPQLSDLRSSGQVEQDADVVLFVHREELYDPTEENFGMADLIIGKQRNGPIGQVKLAYLKQHTRFEDLYEVEETDSRPQAPQSQGRWYDESSN